MNREPVPEALDWIESEMQVMLGMQRPDGHVEDWYGEGNFNRTALLYAYMKSQGVPPGTLAARRAGRRRPRRRAGCCSHLRCPARPHPVRLRAPHAA